MELSDLTHPLTDERQAIVKRLLDFDSAQLLFAVYLLDRLHIQLPEPSIQDNYLKALYSVPNTESGAILVNQILVDYTRNYSHFTAYFVAVYMNRLEDLKSKSETITVLE
jgi:hypothetical protein